MVSILGSFKEVDKMKVKDEWREEDEYMIQLSDVLSKRSGASMCNIGPDHSLEGKQDNAEKDFVLRILKKTVNQFKQLRTELTEYLYLGSARDASSLPLIRRLGITHIINCATKVPQDVVDRLTNNTACDYLDKSLDLGAAAEASGVQNYILLGADDSPAYEILERHYEKARRGVEGAKRSGGKVLIHCELGINRSTTLCVAYLVDTLNITLLKAVKQIKFDRPNILCNEGFRRQLIRFARERKMLYQQ